MSFLNKDLNAEIERGPRVYDILAVAFIPMGISRIGRADPAPASADTAASGFLVRGMSANDLLGIQFITLGVCWLWFRWRG